MKYRRFGKLNWQVSILGFGAMRLPTVSGDAAKIDEAEATKMIRYAIDHGVNYVDTAYVYHRGNSETFLAKALQDGYRQKVKLATKMPTWLVNNQEDMDRYLSEQLARLQTGEIDFYLLHGLDKERWTKLTELNVFDWAERKMAEGKIKYLGFSFHDEFEVFKNIIDSYSGWTFCQMQYNYVDRDFQAGTRGLKYASQKGLAVVVMEPIAGGRLAQSPPKQVLEIFDKASIKRTAAEWALRWVWNHREVSVALSGMSTMQQVMENVESANHAEPNTLVNHDLELIEEARRKFSQLGFVACTGCRYCIPCPEGVNIPQILGLYNEFYVKDRSDEIKTKYWEHITPESQAKRCARCGKCEELCPQKVPIREFLARAAFIFEEKP